MSILPLSGDRAGRSRHPTAQPRPCDALESPLSFVHATLTQLPPLLMRLTTDLSSRADPAEFAAYVRPCIATFSSVARAAKALAGAPDGGSAALSEHFACVVRDSLSFFRGHPTDWQILALFSPVLICFVELQLGRGPRLAPPDLRLIVRGYRAAFQVRHCQAGTAVEDFAAAVSAIPDLEKLPGIAELAGAVARARSPAAQALGLRVAIIGAAHTEHTRALQCLLQAITRLEQQLLARDAAAALHGAIGRLFAALDGVSVLALQEGEWAVTADDIAEFCALDPPWRKSRAPKPVGAELERAFPNAEWALLRPDSYRNCVRHLVGFFSALDTVGQDLNASLDEHVYQNLLIAKHKKLEKLKRAIGQPAEGCDRIERMAWLLQRASGTGLSPNAQYWTRVLGHLFSLLAIVGDVPGVDVELRTALPSPVRVSEALGTPDLLARLESLAGVVLNGRERVKATLNEALHSSNEQGIQPSTVDSMHSAMLVSRDFLSIFAANSDACLSVLEFVSVYAEFLAEIKAEGTAAPDPVSEQSSRDLEASVALEGLVTASAVRFGPVADIAVPWIRLVVGLLNANVARPAFAEFAPFPDFSQLLVKALRALDRLNIDVAADAPGSDFLCTLDSFKGALIQGLTARTFGYQDLIDKFTAVTNRARRFVADIEQVSTPVLVFIRNFHLIWRFAHACAPEAPLLSAVVGNFMLGVRGYLEEQGASPMMIARIEGVTAQFGMLFTPLDPIIEEMAAAIRDVKAFIDDWPTEARDRVLACLPEMITGSDDARQMLGFEIEGLAAMLDERSPACQKAVAVRRIDRLALGPEIGQALDAVLGRCLFECFFAQVLLLCWTASAGHRVLLTAAGAEPPFGSQLPGALTDLSQVLAGLCMLKTEAARLAERHRQPEFAEKVADFTAAVAKALPPIELPAEAQAILAEEYAGLAEELEALEAAEAMPSAADLRASIYESVLDDQLLQVDIDIAEQTVAELRRELEAKRHRLNRVMHGGQGPQRGAPQTALSGDLARCKREALRAELEAELARLTAENEELKARKRTLENRRPSTLEDEMQLLRHRFAASARVKWRERVNEKENAAVRKEITKANESIELLRKQLTKLERGDGDAVELRLAAFRGRLTVKGVLPFMTQTIAKLESLAAARKEIEQHS
jgi:hypothetical protein